MSQIYISDIMVDLSDSRLEFALADANSNSARIVARFKVDIGVGKKIEVGNHSESLSNSIGGRARLAEYPQQVQSWLIPGIWGTEPTVTETTATN